MISVIFGCSFLLTIPPSVGYEQNPLSLYYCYNLEGSSKRLIKCIGQVLIYINICFSLLCFFVSGFYWWWLEGFFFGRLQIRHGGNEWHLFSTLNLTWLLNHYKSVLSWYVTLMMLHHLLIDLVNLWNSSNAFNFLFRICLGIGRLEQMNLEMSYLYQLNHSILITVTTSLRLWRRKE